MTKTQTLTEEQRFDIVADVKIMLHASRDCLRNRWDWNDSGRRERDPSKVSFVVADGYYGEAFGMMRALVALGYGYFGPDNCDDQGRAGINVKRWFSELCEEVLKEENFGGSNECDYCREKYGKDGAGRKREQDGRRDA